MKECTYPWSHLAERTIDPVTLIKCITGSNNGTEALFDYDALSTIVTAEKPWKTLFQLVLKEDRRLGEVLSMEYDRGALLRHTRKQLTSSLYFKKIHNNEFFVSHWFFVVSKGKGILHFPKYIKIDIKKFNVVKQLSQLGVQNRNMKTHFEPNIIRQAKDGTKTIFYEVSQNTKIIS